MGAARQFWLLVVPALVGFTALGLLTLAFFFPEKLLVVGRPATSPAPSSPSDRSASSSGNWRDPGSRSARPTEIGPDRRRPGSP